MWCGILWRWPNVGWCGLARSMGYRGITVPSPHFQDRAVRSWPCSRRGPRTRRSPGVFPPWGEPRPGMAEGFAGAVLALLKAARSDGRTCLQEDCRSHSLGRGVRASSHTRRRTLHSQGYRDDTRGTTSQTPNLTQGRGRQCCITVAACRERSKSRIGAV
jgi:hypothetical protein